MGPLAGRLSPSWSRRPFELWPVPLVEGRAIAFFKAGAIALAIPLLLTTLCIGSTLIAAERLALLSRTTAGVRFARSRVLFRRPLELWSGAAVIRSLRFPVERTLWLPAARPFGFPVELALRRSRVTSELLIRIELATALASTLLSVARLTLRTPQLSVLEPPQDRVGVLGLQPIERRHQLVNRGGSKSRRLVVDDDGPVRVARRHKGYPSPTWTWWSRVSRSYVLS